MRGPRYHGTVHSLLQQLLDAKGRLGGCVVHGQPLPPPGPTHDDVLHDASSETIVLFPRVEEPVSWAVLVQPLDDANLSVGSKVDLFLHHEDNGVGQVCRRERASEEEVEDDECYDSHGSMAGAPWSPQQPQPSSRNRVKQETLGTEPTEADDNAVSLIPFLRPTLLPATTPQTRSPPIPVQTQNRRT